jgi:hypothetical protein
MCKTSCLIYKEHLEQLWRLKTHKFSENKNFNTFFFFLQSSKIQKRPCTGHCGTQSPATGPLLLCLSQQSHVPLPHSCRSLLRWHGLREACRNAHSSLPFVLLSLTFLQRDVATWQAIFRCFSVYSPIHMSPMKAGLFYFFSTQLCPQHLEEGLVHSGGHRGVFCCCCFDSDWPRIYDLLASAS